MGVSYAQAAKSRRAVESWFGLGGKFRGYNIGLACGKNGGIFAIDVDVEDKKGNKGFLALDMLEQEFGKLPETQIQRTASGGTHYIFQWTQGAKHHQVRSQKQSIQEVVMNIAVGLTLSLIHPEFKMVDMKWLQQQLRQPRYLLGF